MNILKLRGQATAATLLSSRPSWDYTSATCLAACHPCSNTSLRITSPENLRVCLLNIHGSPVNGSVYAKFSFGTRIIHPITPCMQGLAGAATLLSASNRTEYRGIRIRGTLFRAALAPGYSGYATDNSGVMLQWTKRGTPQVLCTPSLRIHVANVFRSRTVAYCIYTDLMYSRARIDL